jgi:hypothetical protein
MSTGESRRSPTGPRSVGRGRARKARLVVDFAHERKGDEMQVQWMALSEDQFVEELDGLADALEDDERRDDLYKALGEMLDRWAPGMLDRGELASV